MTQAVILHTIKDAKHCLKQGFHKGARLFSTNVNVAYYLKYEHNIECKYLLSYVNPVNALQTSEMLLKVNDFLLAELDQLVSPKINQQLDLSLFYFKALYSPITAWLLQIYVNLHDCIKKMLEESSAETVLIYEAQMGLLSTSWVDQFITRIFPDVDFFRINHRLIEEAKTKVGGVNISDIPGLLSEHFLKDTFLKRKGAGKYNIFVFEQLGEWPVLKQDCDSNIYGFQSCKPRIYNYELNNDIFPQVASLKTIKSANTDIRKFLTLLYNDICKDFSLNIVGYLQEMYYYCKLHEQVAISEVYWKAPPIQGVKSLILEYFMTNRYTRVIGVQSHVAWILGQVNMPHLEKMLLERCHFYLTQGITSKHIGELNSGYPSPAKIIPTEYLPADTERKEYLNKKQEVDIAVCLRSTFSFLITSQLSIFTDIHESLVNYLNLKQGKKTHLIVNENSNIENFSMLSVAKVLRNIDVIKDKDLNSYLRKYNPKLIIMDLIMPMPLDMFDENIIIIVIADSEYSFSNEMALETFKRRVYYVQKYEEIQYLLEKYFEGLLESKIDNLYVRMFRNEKGLDKELPNFADDNYGGEL